MNSQRKEDEVFASFENTLDDRNIVLTLDWDTGTGITFTTIKPNEVAEIRFDNRTAVICHRSDGGSYSRCPNELTIAKAGDYFQLDEDGKYIS
ncbi:hypothetical protein [Pedobacter sp. ASV12]|uniref:hypothetical protein n=1 Tax=Pedobacter sp. ASV12 TaxID=2795120 RepID=UPI0018EBB8B8|nr:hypothetical protein [Pedobacter sp. ASV12]